MKYHLQLGCRGRKRVITQNEFIQLELLMGFISKENSPATLGFTKNVNGALIKAWPILKETK